MMELENYTVELYLDSQRIGLESLLAVLEDLQANLPFHEAKQKVRELLFEINRIQRELWQSKRT